MSRLHQPSSDENCFSPVLLAQKKMKTAKEERAEKIKVNSLIILLMEFLFRQVILTFFVQVCVRCRPMNRKEIDERAKRCVDVNEKTGEIKIGNKKNYSFDKVFGPNSDQVSVYKEVVTPIINEVLQGKYNQRAYTVFTGWGFLHRWSCNHFLKNGM